MSDTHGNYWDEQEAMIGEELARREKKESNMSVTEINWGYNCLTAGIHHGRPETIWNLPLNYAIGLFSKDQLALLVLTRIYRDALQITLHNEQFTTEWANRVRAEAEKRYDTTLQHKIGEISTYYKSPNFKADLDHAVELVEQDKLNPGFKPLHPHDSINLLCRIIGTSASIQASKEVG